MFVTRTTKILMSVLQGPVFSFHFSPRGFKLSTLRSQDDHTRVGRQMCRELLLWLLPLLAAHCPWPIPMALYTLRLVSSSD